MRNPINLIIGLIIILFLPLSLFLQDLAGGGLICLTFCIATFAIRYYKSWQLSFAFILVLFAHHAISIINIYYFIVIGADMDAVGFHENARTMAHSVQPDWFGEFGNMEAGSSTYTRLLAFFYRLLGDSKLFGQELSILAFTLSIIVLIKIIEKLNLTKWRIGLVLIYGLLPSLVIYTSITMREAYQVLAFLLVIYWGLCLRERPSLNSVLLIMLSATGLGILHNGLIIYALFLVFITFLWGLGVRARGQNNKNLLLKLIGAAVLGIALTAWFTVASDWGGAARALVAGEGTDYAGGYREKLGDIDRASYGGKLDTSSIVAFVPSAIWVMVLYMVAPFPWQISSLADVYAASEGYLRLLLIYQAFATWYRVRGERRRQWEYMLLCYFSLELLWAMGTSNWGTAIRHHVVAYGLLVVLGGPGLLRVLQRFFTRIFSKRRVTIRRRPRLAISTLTFRS